MEQIPRGVYTPEFREQAVGLVLKNGESLRAVALRLSMPIGTLKKWVTAARNGKLGEIGKAQKPLTELELARLRKELAETRMERDFLKKCAAYFVKESR